MSKQNFYFLPQVTLFDLKANLICWERGTGWGTYESGSKRGIWRLWKTKENLSVETVKDKVFILQLFAQITWLLSYIRELSLQKEGELTTAGEVLLGYKELPPSSFCSLMFAPLETESWVSTSFELIFPISTCVSHFLLGLGLYFSVLEKYYKQ